MTIRHEHDLRHSTIPHRRPRFCELALPERLSSSQVRSGSGVCGTGNTDLAVLGTLVRDEADNNESDNGDTSEHTQTNGQDRELGSRKLELGRRAGGRRVRGRRSGRSALVPSDRSGRGRRSGRGGCRGCGTVGRDRALVNGRHSSTRDGTRGGGSGGDQGLAAGEAMAGHVVRNTGEGRKDRRNQAPRITGGGLQDALPVVGSRALRRSPDSVRAGRRRARRSGSRAAPRACR